MEIVFLAALGVAAGLIAGLFGVGGGTIFLPALTLIVGLSAIESIGTSLVAIIPLALVGTWQQRRTGDVRLRDASVIGVAAVVSGVAGAVLADHLPVHVMRLALAAVIVLIAARLAFTTWRAGQQG